MSKPPALFSPRWFRLLWLLVREHPAVTPAREKQYLRPIPGVPDRCTCEAEEPIIGVQCERPEYHDGAHIYTDERTVIAWGWPMEHQQ